MSVWCVRPAVWAWEFGANTEIDATSVPVTVDATEASASQVIHILAVFVAAWASERCALALLRTTMSEFSFGAIRIFAK